MTFEQWLRGIDSILREMWGLTHRDIADRAWYDAWESGWTPHEMVDEIRSEGIDAL